MKCVYGVVDMLPDEFVQLLPRNVRVSYELNAPADVLLIPTVDLFKTWFGELARRRVAVVVFDSPELLRNWKISILETTKPAVKLALATPNKVVYRPYNPIKQMLDSSQGSFVSDLTTMVYKVKDQQRQAEIKAAVFSALYNDQVQQLVSKITNAPELVKLLQSEDSARLTAALRDVQNKCSPKQAAARNNVSSFDIQYVTKFVERLNNDS